MTDDKRTPSRTTQRRRVKAWYEGLFSDIPAGLTPIEATAAVKCIDAEGHVCLYNLKTPDLNTWEALGMLISASDDMRAMLQSAADEDDDE